MTYDILIGTMNDIAGLPGDSRVRRGLRANEIGGMISEVAAYGTAVTIDRVA